MQCTNCGIELITGSGFCHSCGKPVTSGTHLTEEQVMAASGLQPNLAGLLCYVAGFITGVLFLVVDPYKRNRFVRFHAFQAIFLSAVWVAIYAAVEVSVSLLPGRLWRLAWSVWASLSLAFLLAVLFVMYKAYKDERFKLPIIGQLAERQA